MSRKTKRSDDVDVEIIKVTKRSREADAEAADDEETAAVAVVRSLVLTFQEMWTHEVVTRPMVGMLANVLRWHAAHWCRDEDDDNDDDDVHSDDKEDDENKEAQEPVPAGVTVEHVMMAIADELRAELDVCPGWVSMLKIRRLSRALSAHATDRATPNTLPGTARRRGCFPMHTLSDVLAQARCRETPKNRVRVQLRRSAPVRKTPEVESVHVGVGVGVGVDVDATVEVTTTPAAAVAAAAVVVVEEAAAQPVCSVSAAADVKAPEVESDGDETEDEDDDGIRRAFAATRSIAEFGALAQDPCVRDLVDLVTKSVINRQPEACAQVLQTWKKRMTFVQKMLDAVDTS